MSQHDMIIDNSTGANVRADINNALGAIATNNSGSSAPSTTYALQSFANTTDSMLQLRNSANNAFVNLRKFDGSCPLPDGTNSAPSLFFDDDTNTGLYSSAADTLNFATGGTERMELGTTTIFNEDGADVDFRIEGDTEANLFQLDAGNDRIGVAIAAPRARFDLGNIVTDTTALTRVADRYQLVLEATDSSARFSNNIGFILSGGTTVVAAINTFEDGGNGATGLSFATSSNSSSDPVAALTIDSTGRVGIGASSFNDAAEYLLVKNDSTAANISIVASNDAHSSLNLGDEDDFNIQKIKSDHTDNSLGFFTGNLERFRVDSSGNVGIGTTSPAQKLHIDGASNDPFILLQRSGAGDAAVDIGGVQMKNSTNVLAEIRARSDDLNDGILKFSTMGGGTLSERLRITQDGNIKYFRFNTLFGNEGLELFNSTSGGPQLQISRISANPLLLNRNTTDGQIAEFRRGWGAGGSIDVGVNSCTYNTSSDYRLKENIVPISDGITRLKTLKPSRFNWIGDTSSTRDGFIAHEVTAVPEAITGTKDEVYTEDQPNINIKAGDPKYQGIDQSRLVPLLVAAVQELITKVETLEAA